ncbi:unnamed protein product [Schistosoma margrebowiei]|uniref:Uncharacterized protein n=1 Tax=Schistosoma margrebowiei TaxID=48269 RepID=A0A183MZ49_9TREM|nr:unnamed protein product [Schistosoma margrebowiei]
MLQYSGHEEVDLMLSKEAHNALIRWDPRSSKHTSKQARTGLKLILSNVMHSPMIAMTIIKISFTTG